MDYRITIDSQGNPCLEVKASDYSLITHPLLNKGMAFTPEERDAFHLFGLLPPQITTLDIQRKRSYEAFKNKFSDLEKYIYLRDLQDSNETLFYSLVCEHIEEIMPIIYTPTVGLGCQQFSHIYRRPRGVFISYPERQRIESILSNPRFNNTRVIVVSDGERILGLGDQGAGGMGIPIGKLSLYTACAGIYPGFTLPIFLDVGTNNSALQDDPLYIGWAHERIRGQEYYDFVDAFISAVKKRFSHVLVQWEDFDQKNANPLLERYRDQVCSFNDDIQGTAAIAVGTLLAAIRATGTHLRDQRIVIVGAGSAGCGISMLIKQSMITDGLSDEDARKRFFLVDRNGLLTDNGRELLAFQKPFAQSLPTMSFKEVISHAHPTLLIGVSGQGGIFTQDIVEEMAKHVERPIIFPLSNPTPYSEATPTDLLAWTNGRAIIGTGSPFGNIEKNGKSFRVDQTNNSYIFPGLGLGLMATRSRLVTDRMFMAAAVALADCSPTKNNPNANLLPPLTEIRNVSLQVAIAVAIEAFSSGLANIDPPADLEHMIRQLMWQPEYLPYKRWK